jgi:hypothetical protein
VIPGLQRKAGMQEADQNNGNIVLRFFSSPLRSKYPPPMTHIGDYFAVAGLVLFCISVFGLDWMASRDLAWGTASSSAHGRGVWWRSS